MQRRRWLQLGAGAAVLLAVGGGVATLVQPGLAKGKLTPASRQIFATVGSAILEGSLPTEAGTRATAIAAFVQRVDALVHGLPGFAQDELSQLLSLLATSAGRRVLA